MPPATPRCGRCGRERELAVRFLPPRSGGGGPPKAAEGAATCSEFRAAPSTTLRVVPLPRASHRRGNSTASSLSGGLFAELAGDLLGEAAAQFGEVVEA